MELPLELDTKVVSQETACSFHSGMPSFDIISNAYFNIANECSFGNMLFLGDSVYGSVTDKNDKGSINRVALSLSYTWHTISVNHLFFDFFFFV